MGYAEIIAAAVAAIGAFISAGKEGEAQKLREQIAAEYGPQILPQLDKAVAQQAGQAAPRTENDQGRREQLDVLSQLDNEYQNAGHTAADEAAYTTAGRKVAQRAGQQAGDLGLEAARRGQQGSGMASVLQSQAGQNELEALASLDADVASQGRGRGLQALGMKGQMASGVRGDDWKSVQAGADATDLMNRFNASQRQQTEMHNVNIPQQQYDNNMQRLAAQNAARTGVAGGLEQQGANARQTAAGIGNAALDYGAGWDWGQKKSPTDEEAEKNY